MGTAMKTRTLCDRQALPRWILGSSPRMTTIRTIALEDWRGGGILPVISPLEGEMSATLTEGGGDETTIRKRQRGGSTPLCPAGHLPLKGGDRTDAPLAALTLPTGCDLETSGSTGNVVQASTANVVDASASNGVHAPTSNAVDASAFNGVQSSASAVVILGLDPRIHATPGDVRRGKPDLRPRWILGSSPRMTPDRFDTRSNGAGSPHPAPTLFALSHASTSGGTL
jgi:hypothetical protein